MSSSGYNINKNSRRRVSPTVEEVLAALPASSSLSARHEEAACSVCEKHFRNRSALRLHSVKVHGEEKHRCLQPDTQHAWMRGGYEEEEEKISRKGSNEKCTFVCPIVECGKEFSAAKLLLQHYQKTHTERRFKCSECGNAFALERDLRYHAKKQCKAIKQSDDTPKAMGSAQKSKEPRKGRLNKKGKKERDQPPPTTVVNVAILLVPVGQATILPQEALGGKGRRILLPKPMPVIPSRAASPCKHCSTQTEKGAEAEGDLSNKDKGIGDTSHQHGPPTPSSFSFPTNHFHHSPLRNMAQKAASNPAPPPPPLVLVHSFAQTTNSSSRSWSPTPPGGVVDEVEVMGHHPHHHQMVGGASCYADSLPQSATASVPASPTTATMMDFGSQFDLAEYLYGPWPSLSNKYGGRPLVDEGGGGGGIGGISDTELLASSAVGTSSSSHYHHHHHHQQQQSRSEMETQTSHELWPIFADTAAGGGGGGAMVVGTRCAATSTNTTQYVHCYCQTPLSWPPIVFDEY